ncbi:hypothetical protein [Nocardia sp. NPDC052112]|uniref:hypothetical protein n=1 Tax=Nocardia sp. NPDC052112 TaxID=3155646 RepID=UPI00341E9CB5
MPDTTAIDTITRGANDLAKLRRLVLGLALGTVAVTAVLIAIHPTWIFGAPLLVGGVLLAFRPTYKKRRARAMASVRTGIALNPSTAVPHR